MTSHLDFGDTRRFTLAVVVVARSQRFVHQTSSQADLSVGESVVQCEPDEGPVNGLPYGRQNSTHLLLPRRRHQAMS